MKLAMIFGFKALCWPPKSPSLLVGKNVSSVAGRPSKPPPNLMVGSVHFPKSRPSLPEGGGLVNGVSSRQSSWAAYLLQRRYQH